MAEAVSQTWVCQAWHCGEVYDGSERFCPTCRNVAMPQKSIRRRGIVALACGVFITGMMVALGGLLGPTLLAAGQDVDGSTFSGSKSDGLVVLGLFAALGLFGLVAIVSGFYQLRYGRQNWRLFGGMIAVLVVIGVIVAAIQYGFVLNG
jgi:hypothetical protein